jgi:hypothetical protein
LVCTGSKYLLVSETGGESYRRPSKIWFDVLSDRGTPLNILPTIIDNGDSLHQMYPTCAYQNERFLAVWQTFRGKYSTEEYEYSDLYGAMIDTVGDIISSCYINGSNWNKIHPSIATGGGKCLLVWADKRNGDYDIYGMLLDSLVCPDKDVAVISIECPGDTVYVDSAYGPVATIKNFGQMADSVRAICIIDTGDIVYCDSETVYLSSEKSASVAFSPEWQVGSDTAITYNVTVYTTQAGDENRSNDTLRTTVRSVVYTGVAEQAIWNARIGEPELHIFPNPFLRMTTIRYSMPRKVRVSLKVFDVTGRCVETLVSGEKNPGYHETKLGTKNLGHGVYFARFEAGDYKEVRKLILMR